MNAPHPIRALHGHLAIVGPNPGTIPAVAIPSYERVHGDGELCVGVAGLDGLLESLGTMAWHVERAVERGAGQPYDLNRLQRITERLAEIHQKVEMSAGRLTSKLAGAR
ncbi:hypothetical protein CIW48_19250 [Methylobacterium sp. P1-11]|uniref:hypothetical protein n=1 Tax=Methylobacterium sp. P1-11 TaxID=2024616 RepID=UPI0011EF040A|nr:hypothetical protein [Methylobacterium sp. P1-11]KAA0122138.1 hypothetical protein CIW48_19250 [Methylobacterium sp. P1-11]